MTGRRAAAAAPQRFVAFLRAINVGGHTVKMDRLRLLFEGLGFANVETFIASGNVLFDTSAKSAQELEETIAAHLEAALGYEVATFLRTPKELAAIDACRPFAGRGPQPDSAALYIGFLAEAPAAAAKRKLMDLRADNDDFHVNGRELYWLCRKLASESTISGRVIEKALGMPATLRNANTVRKLAAKLAPAPKSKKSA